MSERNMTVPPEESAVLRFGLYELDSQSGELRREGTLVRLPPQPFKVLWMLVRRAGEVVTREEIRQELWGNDTFVDFDGGLNFCINQIRRALRDSAESPLFVHTLPRRGYRFLASVESASAPARASLAPSDDPHATLREASRPLRYPLLEGGVGRNRTSAALDMHEAAPDTRIDTAPEERPETAAGAPAGPATTRTDEPSRDDAPRPAGRDARLGALILVVATAAAGLLLPWRSPAPPHFQRITFRRGMIDDARFAPGGQVVYTASWDGKPTELFSVRPEAPESRSLGKGQIAAVADSGEMAVLLPGKRPSVLARVPAAGGPPRAIKETVMSADWTASSDVLALVRREKGQDLVEFPAGRQVFRAPPRLSHLRISPDGSQLAVLEHPFLEDDRGSLVLIDREGRRSLLSGDWASAEGVAWHPSGEVWFTAARVGAEAALQAVDLRGNAREVTRVPGRLVLHDIASDGRVLLQRNNVRLEMRAQLPDGVGERDLSWLDFSAVSDISADGRQIVFGESGEGGGPRYSVYLRQTDGTAPVRLGEGRPFTLSPDGRWVVAVPLDGGPRLMLLPTGSGEPRVLPGPGLSAYAHVAWFPDSRRVLITARTTTGESRVFMQGIDGGPPRLLSRTGFASARVVSPDGRVLMASGDRKPPYSLTDVESGAEQPVPALSSEERPLAFSPDGRSVIVRRGQSPVLVERVDLTTGARESLHTVAPRDPAGAGPVGWLAVTPDGRSLVYSFHRTMADLYVVDGLR